MIEKLKEGDYFLPELENIEVGKETLNTFDVEHIDLVALLWQTGYLTFEKKNKFLNDVTYQMKVPNLEVQKSLNALFYDYLTNLEKVSAARKRNLANLFLNEDIQGIRSEITAMFASISYQNYVNNTISNFEGYYASVLFAFLSSIGFEVKTEDSTNKGRVDLSLIGPNIIYILEFKVDMSAEAALYQIKKKKYYEKYLAGKKRIYLIGMHFSSKERNIVGLEWEKV